MDSKADYVLGAGAGYLTYKGAGKVASQLMVRPYAEFAFSSMKNYTNMDNKVLRKATFDAFNSSGLKAKHVALHDVNPKNKEKMIEVIIGKIIDTPIFQKLTKAYNKKYGKYADIMKPLNKEKIIKSVKSNKRVRNIFNPVADGKNASFHPITKDIMVNMGKLAGASFHEMGHALNATGSKAIKSLVVVRHITPLSVPAILAVGLFKPKKAEGQQPRGFMDKATTFIKNNAGALTFMAMMPILLEEGLASIRGGKLAKKVIPSAKLLKKVNKNNLLAWGTYLGAAAVTTGAVKLGIFVRDKVAERKNNV